MDLVIGLAIPFLGTTLGATMVFLMKKEMNKKVEKLGVDGVLIVTPYYNKTTGKGLIRHYSEIAKNTSLPIILYNVPSRTGVNIEPQTALELSKIEKTSSDKKVAQILETVKKELNCLV